VAAYDRQKDLIIDATRKYVVQNEQNITWTDNTATIYLSDLQNAHLLNNPLRDPRGGTFNNTKYGTKVIITRNGDQYTYDLTAVSGEVVIPIADNSGASKPELLSNMIPVKWNGSTWTKADINNYKDDNAWYDYDNQMWANAVTVTSTSRAGYQSAALGKEILMNDILTFFVWIPRYKYLIPSGTEPRQIDIVFENKITTKSTGDAIITYLTHPAFTFGSNELNGIWVGKFETTGDMSTITIKPNLVSLKEQTVSAIFNAVRAMQNTENVYGFSSTGIDAHLIKSMEWGSVAYFSHSKYGINNEVWINPADNYTTGCAGDSASSGVTTGCLRTYDDTTNEINASTTGNIYGIYDMSGGSWEYVMGNYNDVILDSGFTSLPDSKYYDKYTTATSIKGDAINADGTNGWYSDVAYDISSTYPWLGRGGTYGRGVGAGVMAFGNSTGAAISSWSFRIVVAPTS
jgi:hypothetical protein